MLQQPAFLGQVPLVLGPGSWGFGQVPIITAPVPPFFGEWGSPTDGGRVGPFDTVEEALAAATAEARKIGGFALVKDSLGNPVVPVS